MPDTQNCAYDNFHSISQSVIDIFALNLAFQWWNSQHSTWMMHNTWLLLVWRSTYDFCGWPKFRLISVDSSRHDGRMWVTRFLLDRDCFHLNGRFYSEFSCGAQACANPPRTSAKTVLTFSLWSRLIPWGPTKAWDSRESGRWTHDYRSGKWPCDCSKQWAWGQRSRGLIRLARLSHVSPFFPKPTSVSKLTQRDKPISLPLSSEGNTWPEAVQ